jgi:aspartyl-tRNA(Asn)/glutamyl-tRNA(Gln) amidotransferase subunit C
MIDKATVEYIANLARIELTEEEKETLRPQLSGILEYIEKLNELDVSGVEPTKEPFVKENVLRDDVVVKSKVLPDIMDNAPAAEDNHFKIPRVI